MSYEGYQVLLCCRGHRSTRDAYDFSEACPVERCTHPFVWAQDVDTTNGENESPWTYPRGLEIHGHDDIPRVDHYGNHYFIKEIRYKIPDGGSGEGRHLFNECKMCRG
jgi:hypothetical protein